MPCKKPFRKEQKDLKRLYADGVRSLRNDYEWLRRFHVGDLACDLFGKHQKIIHAEMEWDVFSGKKLLFDVVLTLEDGSKQSCRSLDRAGDEWCLAHHRHKELLRLP